MSDDVAFAVLWSSALAISVAVICATAISIAAVTVYETPYETPARSEDASTACTAGEGA